MLPECINQYLFDHAFQHLCYRFQHLLGFGQVGNAAHCAVRTSAAFATQLCGDFFDQLACVCACLDRLGAADCQHAGFALVGRCKHSNHVWSICFDLVTQGAQAVRSGVLEDCMDIAYTLDRNGVGKQLLHLAVGNLPEPVLEMVEEGEVSPGHARALLSFDDPQRMMDVAQKVRTGKYSVRDIERMSKEQEEKEKKSAEEKPQLWGAQASIFTELELALTSELGRKVKVVCSGKDAGGSLQLQFFDEEDLRQLAQKLTKE